MGTRPQRPDGVWLDFVADLLAAPLTRWPYEEVARLLVETFDAATVTFSSRTLPDGRVRQRWWPPEHFAGHLEEVLDWWEHHAPTELPNLRYHLTTWDPRCIQVADVPARFADERVLAAWTERGRQWGGVQAQLSIPVLCSQSVRRLFLVGRPATFTPPQMRLARRLQRVLVGLDRQICTFSRLAEDNEPAAGELAGCLSLTPRELAVLELLAQGLTAAAIGRRLTITEKTAQKHLEHIYSKLGVGDRVTAVRHAQRVGLLTVPWPGQHA